MVRNDDLPGRGGPNPGGGLSDGALPAGDTAAGNAPVPARGSATARRGAFANPMAAPSRFRIDRSAGVWTVTKDGLFAGDYLREAHAEAAVATASGS